MSLEGPDFNSIKVAVKEGRGQDALRLLRGSIRPEDHFVVQARAAKIFRTIVPLIQGQRKIRVALIGGSTVDHLGDLWRLWLGLAGFDADLYIAPHGMVVQTVLDTESDLYHFKPDLVWLFSTYRDVKLDIKPGADASAVRSAVDAAIRNNARLWRPLIEKLNCIILQNNADCPADDPFGNFAGTAPWGMRSALRLYNVHLGAAAVPGVVVLDLDHIAALHGKVRWFDSRYWFHSKHAMALDAAGAVAAMAAKLTAAAKGLSKKCLVLDLDNTLWGGIIGDDGIDGIALGDKVDGEAFAEFQSYALALKERGIILAVCSKNEELNAKEPFERHPDMRLRLSDIAVFKANWNNKAENIAEIAKTLNIGLDSLVFVDDNPTERDIVRKFLPTVEVPEMPSDPADYVRAVASNNFFETTSFSEEDRERARYYRENAQRAELQLTFEDTAGYLTSLQMAGQIGDLDSFHLPRMAQLINKSNQFHLTGTRYSEADLAAFSERPDYVLRHFKLRDRFGDNGLIAVLITRVMGRDLVIDTWAMSCRVLARSMEEFICNELLCVARARGCTAIVGTYRPSAKNKLVAELYRRLGFTMVSDNNGVTTWRFEIVPAYKGWTAHIRMLECEQEITNAI